MKSNPTNPSTEDNLIKEREMEELATPEQLILEALGEASALFQIVMPDKELAAIAERTAFHIKGLFRKPNLGLATTRQLLAEITARIEVDGQLDYKTVNDD